MSEETVAIDSLIEIVSNGGAVRTGVNVYNQSGALLIQRHLRITNVNHLLMLKNNGLSEVPIVPGAHGGLWDSEGNPISLAVEAPQPEKSKKEPRVKPEVVNRLDQITAVRQEAQVKHKKAREKIDKVLTDIRETGGEFDIREVDDTIDDIFNLITQNESAFAYLSAEIFKHDNYIQNHSVNVCTMGTAILKRFNDHFSEVINKSLFNFSMQTIDEEMPLSQTSFIYYLPNEIRDIALGFFLHDVGMVMVPDEIINKKGALNPDELDLIRRHSLENGLAILDKNRITNPFVKNCVMYHHSALFSGEQNAYPADKMPIEVPPYVKICKLADIYDAMTSKRIYREASNPVRVVTEIFRTYANRDHMLQFVVHSFVKILGIHPPGSVITLQNGQMAYVLESQGPIVLPFTDHHGDTLVQKVDPVDVGDPKLADSSLRIDRRHPLQSPIDVYDILPEYLKQTVNG